MPQPQRIFAAGVACWLAFGSARAEKVLEQFPLVVRSGLSSSAGPRGADETALPDLPFSTDQGYGYVGGTPGRRVGAAAFGGEPGWLLAWREGIEKYVFRVPHGEYRVELTFLETDVAAKGLRVFDVIAEDREFLHQVDIAGTAGDFAWLTLSGSVGVYDGWLDLRFAATTSDRPPRVSRVKILREAADASHPPPASTAASEAEPRDLGLKTYELKIEDEELRRMSVRQDPPFEAPAELHYLSTVDHVLVSYDTELSRWQRKKSFRILPDPQKNRRVLHRKGLYLSAEAGDPTMLRAMVSAEVAASIGFATPAVEPIALRVNGRFEGVYLDVELLDRQFRLRTHLDRVGVLALDTHGDQLAPNWSPYGEQRGEEGNILGLTELVHELNRLGDGDMKRFFEERFYLDRCLDRAAFRLARGASSDRRFLLKDSRNGKWEPLEEQQPNGSLGLRDFELEPRAPTDDDVRRLLLGNSLQAAGNFRFGASVLDTRFWNEASLRQRFFDRVEKLISTGLAPEKLDALVDRAFEKIRTTALIDSRRWPQDGGKAFLEGPARVKVQYRAQVAAVQRVLAIERRKERAPLILNEIVAAPAEGGPWVELRNASDRPVSLDGYFLSSDFHVPSARTAMPSSKPLAPGETLLLRSTEGHRLPLAPSGGFLALWRERETQLPELCDSLFYAHQTAGLAYGRLESGEWAQLSAATPGAPNDARRLEAPPYEYLQGVTAEKNGGVRIWFKSRPNEVAGEKRPEKIALRYREDGATEFQSVDLVWDDKAFQFSLGLEANPARKRTAYYFTAWSAEGVERVFPLPAPELTFFLPVPSGVKLNEVLPRPGRAPGASGEFIEIYNPGDQPVDLEGLFLSDSKRNSTRWRIPAGNVAPPKGFAVFYADGRNRGNHTGFRLSNSGEFLGLFGRMEEGNLTVDTIAFRGVRTGESWGANPDGSKNFRAWKDPTPGARNIPKIPEEYLKKKREEAGQVPQVGAPPKPRDPELNPIPQDGEEPDEDDDH